MNKCDNCKASWHKSLLWKNMDSSLTLCKKCLLSTLKTKNKGVADGTLF